MKAKHKSKIEDACEGRECESMHEQEIGNDDQSEIYIDAAGCRWQTSRINKLFGYH